MNGPVPTRWLIQMEEQLDDAARPPVDEARAFVAAVATEFERCRTTSIG